MPESQMIPVVTASQAALWDERARSDARIPGRVLMEAAGRAAAAVIARQFRDLLGRGVLVVAGPGNNGGDGWVVARALHASGVRVVATEVPNRRSADCEANRALALADGVALLEAEAPWPAVGLVVDALLGTGAADAPRGALAELARRAAGHGPPIAAIDGPTGLDLTSGTAHGPIRAALSVTFGGLRRGHLLARDWVGRIVVVDIGFPPPDPSWPVFVTDAWAAGVLPPLAPAMHKGDRGRVLVIGGDVGMAGAAMHVGRAAFACGAGLVKLALAEPSIRAAQANLPDALTLTTALGPGIEPELSEAIAWADAIVLGPGLGRGEQRSAFVLAVLERATQPVVIDADALQVLGARAAGRSPRVLTPHPGEFAAQFPEIADLARRDRFGAPAAALKYCAPTGSVRSAAPPARLTPGASPGLEEQEGSRLNTSLPPEGLEEQEGSRLNASLPPEGLEEQGGSRLNTSLPPEGLEEQEGSHLNTSLPPEGLEEQEGSRPVSSLPPQAPGLRRGSAWRQGTAVLLKGVPTVIAAAHGTRVVGAGNPALATGGTGDLLAGTIAAWLARGLAPLDAAALGAQVMGRAADLAAAERGARVTRPEDVAAAYPALWRHWAEPATPEPPVLLRLDPPAVV
jgi:ADP-dependent NAD(P)H-hydrate dehydratase / NAD(P)H-hydrate epimerase